MATSPMVIQSTMMRTRSAFGAAENHFVNFDFAISFQFPPAVLVEFVRDCESIGTKISIGELFLPLPVSWMFTRTATGRFVFAEVVSGRVPEVSFHCAPS